MRLKTHEIVVPSLFAFSVVVKEINIRVFYLITAISSHRRMYQFAAPD
jgi:hypothetical protein